jgi:hypothetical protein
VDRKICCVTHSTVGLLHMARVPYVVRYVVPYVVPYVEPIVEDRLRSIKTLQKVLSVQ